MNLRPLLFRFLLPLLALVPAGCTTSISARKVVALDRYPRVYVERRLNDNHRIDELFVEELRRLGRDASSGPLTMMPEKIDLLLTYDTRWEWDFKTYLIELNLEVHTVHPRKKLADARYYQPNVRNRAPPEVIREVIDRLFVQP